MTNPAPRPWPPGGGAMAARVRAHDWAATPLGGSGRWPAELKSAVAFVLDSSLPAVFVARRGLVAIPNDACLPLVGNGADALGRSVAEVSPAVGGRVEQALACEAASVEQDHGPEDAWSDLTFNPVRDAEGAVIGCIGLAAQTGSRADAALRESEERLRSFAETSSDVMWIADAETGQLEFLSPAYETIWGEPRDAVMADIGHWATRIHPDDRAAAAEAIGVSRAGGRRMVEYRIVRPDGGVRYINDTGFPILADGKVRRIAGVAQDLTERHRAERALAETEQRLRTLMEGIPQLVWRGVDGGEWTWASPQWTDYTGQPEAESHGHGWLEPVHPDDREQVLAIWTGAVGRGEFHADYRIYHAPEARYRWFQTRASAVRDENGEVIEWLGTSTDVDDLRELQDRQQVLLAELQHRVRNILTVTRSVFSRTVEAGGSIDDVVDHFKGRLDSLARTQVIVTQSATGQADLENLIRDELLSVGGADGPGLTIEGPDVQLEAKAAESIGLAIHELTTNALKYGALKHAGATLSIKWTVNMDYRGRSRLDLKWLEQGVPAIPVKPIREGFGTELITEALPYRLGAETRLDLRGGGVSCSISVPLPDRGASAA